MCVGHGLAKQTVWDACGTERHETDGDRKAENTEIREEDKQRRREERVANKEKSVFTH